MESGQQPQGVWQEERERKPTKRSNSKIDVTIKNVRKKIFLSMTESMISKLRDTYPPQKNRRSKAVFIFVLLTSYFLLPTPYSILHTPDSSRCGRKNRFFYKTPANLA